MIQKKSVVIWGVRIGFLIFFLSGIIMANLWFAGAGTEWNIISESALLNAAEWKFSYFCLYVFLKRLPVFVLLLFFCRHRWKIFCYSAVASWQGFALGYLAAENILNIGIAGLWYYIQILFPHYFIYVLVFLMLLHRNGKGENKNIREENRNRMAIVAGSMLVVVLFAVGVITESYMNRLFLIRL
ncbi:MAG: hypothetical protein HFG80_12635 [Eubacterium sp.]|nr:hypothetical protein [Eubacterium sp.]